MSFAMVVLASLITTLSTVQCLPELSINSATSTIESDSYFYGQSPAIYPAPIASGSEDWSGAYQKAKRFVTQLTLDEKINLTAGYTSTTNGCAGNIAAIPRLHFPGMCLQDAGNGIRGSDFVNGYPSGIHVGASWNKHLAHQRGHYMGLEYRTKGINVILGPTIGPLGRIITSGRNWESYSNDPYLSGKLVAETVQATQGVGVITSTKHFIVNEQESNRVPTTNSRGQSVESVSSNVDDKTLHELYLWPFQEALRAGSGNIMCSYNRINNSHSCQNSKILNGILKGELGFQGFVVSDWGAQHSGVASALAGLDVAMPLPYDFWGNNLTAAIKNGSVPTTRLDDMITRVIATWYQLGQDSSFPDPGIGMPIDITAAHSQVNARNNASRATLMQGAVEGHVLVKNSNHALPLKSPKSLSIYGYDAKRPDTVVPTSSPYGPWGLGYTAFNFLSIIDNLLGIPNPNVISQIAPYGTLLSGGGSAAVTPLYWDAPFDALQQRARIDGTELFWDFATLNSTSSVYENTDACLVFINAYAAEGFDRSGIHDDFSDALVLNIADQCANTIVIIHNAGIRLVDQFVSHPNVTAIIFAHLPGQDSGSALVSLLYGDENFSGKLPYTVAKNESDYGALLFAAQPVEPFMLFPQSNFSEGVYIDYRAFDKLNLVPRYEFGFGLSYTTFQYSNLVVQKQSLGNSGPYPVGPIQQGGHVDLWDTVATVSADIKNTGCVTGQEVVQLYVGIPGGPVKQLRGFEKPSLNSEQSQTLSFPLTRKDLSIWNVVTQKWQLQSGTYHIYVGSSSRILPLSGTLVI